MKPVFFLATCCYPKRRPPEVGGHLNKRFHIVCSKIPVVWDVTPFVVIEILPMFQRNLQLQVEGRRIMNVY